MHGGFIQHCLASNVFFREQLIELHDGPVALHVTRDTRGELRALGPGHTVVTMLCDLADRYASKLYNTDCANRQANPRFGCQSNPFSEARCAVRQRAALCLRPAR